ncbi:MAG: ATP-binding protein [Clostridia bacterium]|nr:ATP-binding protein [Clostridia bacterium]
MYLKRKIDDFLLDWKNNENKKPLIIKGCRQIGKTESIKQFAKNNYSNIIYINFVEETKYKLIIEDSYNVADIIKNISRIDPSKKFIPNETLIIFDELQTCPEIATSLKFFCIDKKYDVICSGSLLGINYKNIESNSVGYKTDYEMSSLDFEEFLWAKGYDSDFIQNILQHMQSLTPFSELEIKLLNDLFLDFSILGGMPAVVKSYIENGTFGEALEIQKQLLIDYEEDIRKYAIGLDQTRILNVYRQLANQLAKENKKFQITKVAKGARFSDYRGCIEWLDDAGIINICNCLNFPELPLKGNTSPDKYKIYYRDSGLLVASLDEESQEDLRVNKNLGVYKGALYENIVGDALVKSGYALYYYKREDSTLEEDFFVRTQHSLVPVEVKATNGSSKSLATLIDSDKYVDIKFGVKLCNGNVGYNGKFYTFPYFCAFLLKQFLSTLK